MMALGSPCRKTPGPLDAISTMLNSKHTRRELLIGAATTAAAAVVPAPVMALDEYALHDAAWLAYRATLDLPEADEYYGVLPRIR